MIFVTVGTTKFMFNRLIEAVDEAILGLGLKEKLVIQKEVGDYLLGYTNTELKSELPFGKMIENFKQARVTITAGGPATIFLALKYGKNKPLVVPRSGRLGEHVDEHEVLFGQFLRREAKATVVLPGEDIRTILTRYLLSPTNNTTKGKIAVSTALIRHLTDITDLWSHDRQGIG